MTSLALALALAASQPPHPGLPSWRLVDLPQVHVSARPAAFIDGGGLGGRVELGAGATLRVTLAWP